MYYLAAGCIGFICGILLMMILTKGWIDKL